METQRVGVREFRDKLATYLLEARTPLAITRHGDTVGYYIPTRPKRTEAEMAAFRDAASSWQKMLDEAGISEDDVIEDFKQWRAEQKA